MNLKSAEDWADEIYPGLSISEFTRNIEIKRARRIQSDALRWAAEQVTKSSEDHQSAIANILYKANQLHPIK